MPPDSAEAIPSTGVSVRDGTPVATAGDVWRGQRNLFMLATARRVHWQTVAAGMVLMVLISAMFLHGGLPPWRIAVQVLLHLMILGFQRRTIMCTREPDQIEHAFFSMVLVAQMFVITSMTLTGGIHSPLLPVLSVTATFPVVFFGPHRLSRGLLLMLGALTLGMALLPEKITGPRMDRAHYTAIALVSFGWTLFAARVLIGRLREATERAAHAIHCLQGERVADTEEQMRRLQAVGAKVAHELKNPLAAIKGLVQLVSRTPESTKTRERLDVVQSEIARMEMILQEYLSFSRPLEDLRPQSIDLAELASDALSVVGGRLENGRISVVTRTRSAPLEADPRRLKEALLNVLANAIDATPSGGTIEVVTRPVIGGIDGKLSGGGVIEIRDTGRGIRPDDLERLGTSFFTTRAAGTGLGVVLAQGVVAQHGGHIHYASEVGRGTRVTITLPPHPAAPPPGEPVLTTSASTASQALRTIEATA